MSGGEHLLTRSLEQLPIFASVAARESFETGQDSSLGAVGPDDVATGLEPLPSEATRTSETLGTASNEAVSAPSEALVPAPWLRTTRETVLWSGEDANAQDFVKVPSDTVVHGVESRNGRTLVFFGGDATGRRPGEAWIDTADVLSTTWPRWVRARRSSELRAEPTRDAPSVATLRPGSYVEILGEQTGRWARAFYLGDGENTEPREGWVEAGPFSLPAASQHALSSLTLTWATLADSRPEVWLQVPYRSQLDGSPYASVNCGPTIVAMILDAYGESDTLANLRAETMERQGTRGCEVCGVSIEHLAEVLEDRDVPTYGMFGPTGKLRAWTLDDIRDQLRAGRVVVPEVRYWFLPGRESSTFWEDHYILLTGMVGDKFIYNDPLDNDGTGYGRLISAEALEKAMGNSFFPFAAFAAGR